MKTTGAMQEAPFKFSFASFNSALAFFCTLAIARGSAPRMRFFNRSCASLNLSGPVYAVCFADDCPHCPQDMAGLDRYLLKRLALRRADTFTR